MGLAGKMHRLDNVRWQKLQLLEKRNHGITKLADWVHDNRSSFRGEVIGPLLLDVSIRDEMHAAYLEQQCPGNGRSPSLTASAHHTISSGR